jgi:chromosomal replication initiation ATPase DnaA
LRSRLLTLPAAALGAPDDELLAALIVKQFRDRQIALDAGVVSYLTTRGARDTASLRNLIDRLDRASLAEGRKVSVALARKIMEVPDV